MSNRLRELLEQALPYVTDPRLKSEIAAALGSQGRRRVASSQALPSWLRELDAAQLILIDQERLRRLGLEGRDPAVVLAEVRKRIDSIAGTDRVPYLIEDWLTSQIAARPRKRVESTPVPGEPRRRKPRTPPAKVNAFATQVAQLFNFSAGFATLLARIIADHDAQADPVGQAALRRICDAFVGQEREVGALMGVNGPDGRYITYVDMGGTDQGTLLYDTFDQTFSLNTPANAARGVGMPQLTVTC